MKYRKIKMSKLSDVGTKKYGKVIDVENIDPNYKCETFSFWENLSVIDYNYCSICMVKSYSREKNKNTIFESHSNTPETIIPLNGDVILLLGKSSKKEKEKLNLNSIMAFKLESGKAVILGKNIWHYAPISINKDVKLLVLFEKDTPGKDTILYHTDEMDSIIYEVEI